MHVSDAKHFHAMGAMELDMLPLPCPLFAFSAGTAWKSTFPQLAPNTLHLKCVLPGRVELRQTFFFVSTLVVGNNHKMDFLSSEEIQSF